MREFAAVVCIAAIVGFSSCTPSLHPLCGEKDAVFDPELVGTWGEQGVREDQEIWQFEKTDDNAYTVIFTETSTKARSVFRARVVRLGGRTFFDAILVEKFMNGVEVDEYALIRPHWFGRLSRQENSIKLALLNEDWLKQAIAANKIRIQHEVLGDGAIVLTAPTKELQSLALKLADDDKAFPWDQPLIRKK